MWLILSDPGDATTQWLTHQLDAVGCGRVRVLYSTELALASGWEHRVDASGASVRFRLSTGERFSSDEIEGGISRIAAPPSRINHNFRPCDVEYATEEWRSFLVSALAAIPGWLNPIFPYSLSGRYRSRFEWCALASTLGLLTATVRTPVPSEKCCADVNPPRDIVVLDDEVFGPEIPGSVGRSAIRLTRAAGLRMAGARFVLERGSWQFVDGSVMPDLRIGGLALVDKFRQLIQ